MDRRKLFNLALIISSSLVLMAALIVLFQAAPATAATRVTTLYEAGSSLDLEGISPVSSEPGLALPPSLPRKGPLLQENSILTITKSADPNPVNAGEVLTYTIVVINGGDANATGVVITDDLDSEVRFAGASDGGSYRSGVVTWNVTEIGIGQTISRTLWVTVTDVASGTILSNTAWVTPTDGIDNSDTITTTVTTAADLQIAKSASVNPVVVGTSFTYAIGVSNNGPSVASGVTVTDALPLGLTFDAEGSSPECSASDQDVTCTIGVLPVSGHLTLAIAVTVDTSLEDGLVLSNTASVSGDEPDPNENDNSATEESLVERIKIFLPILLKPAPTKLSVFNDTTGDDVTFSVRGTPVTCVVPNNTKQFCGTFPPGTYQIRVISACGEGLFTKTYGPGPVTTRVFCR